MKKSYILSFLAAGLLMTGCSKENPFGGETVEEGQILKSALSMDVKADDTERQKSRTRADVNVDDFTVIFTLEGHSQPSAKYKYSEMPEVVTLPAGTYTCTATYGELRQAEWESPYFLGVSEEFTVNPYEIVSYVKPIVCKLENIKVTIDFDSELRSRMSDDSYVEVKVGASSALNFTVAEADAKKAGYFMHTSETTLVATFNGTVDGVKTVETKSMRDIQKGNHYKITFRMHPEGGGGSSGDLDTDVTVDASVTIVDVSRNVPVGEEPLLDDSERPKEDPDDPNPPQPEAPSITAEAPCTLDGVNDGNTLTSCVLNIHSNADGGITAFTCDIVSPNLTEEELQSVGLASHLDLVNTPDDLADALSGLGFPVNVGGHKDVRFEITSFLPMLQIFGPNRHDFVLTVTDANGTTTKTLTIKF